MTDGIEIDDFEDEPPPTRRRKKKVPKGLVPATVETTLYLPEDTDDIVKLAEVGAPQLMRKAVALAAESDNLMAVLSTLKELTDRAHGKAQQSVTQTIELGEKQTKSLEEVARMMLFAKRDAEERGIELQPDDIIDVEPEGVVQSSNDQED